MQPHSMSALAICNFYWNAPEKIVIKGDVTIRVEYQEVSGAYKFNEYRVSNIYESSDRLQLTMYIIRSSGGISCEITARRNSTSEGAEVTMTHGQQHVSGLREVFRLMKKEVINGMHYNSEKYNRYDGRNMTDSSYPRKIKLYSDVKRSDGSFVNLPYDLEITSINYEKVLPTPSNVIQFPSQSGSSSNENRPWWEKKSA